MAKTPEKGDSSPKKTSPEYKFEIILKAIADNNEKTNKAIADSSKELKNYTADNNKELKNSLDCIEKAQLDWQKKQEEKNKIQEEVNNTMFRKIERLEKLVEGKNPDSPITPARTKVVQNLAKNFEPINHSLFNRPGTEKSSGTYSDKLQTNINTVRLGDLEKSPIGRTHKNQQQINKDKQNQDKLEASCEEARRTIGIGPIVDSEIQHFLGGKEPKAENLTEAKILAFEDLLMGDLGMDFEPLGGKDSIETTFRPKGDNKKKLMFIRFNNERAADTVMRRVIQQKRGKKTPTCIYPPPELFDRYKAATNHCHGLRHEHGIKTIIKIGKRDIKVLIKEEGDTSFKEMDLNDLDLPDIDMEARRPRASLNPSTYTESGFFTPKGRTNKERAPKMGDPNEDLTGAKHDGSPGENLENNHEGNKKNEVTNKPNEENSKGEPPKGDNPEEENDEVEYLKTIDTNDLDDQTLTNDLGISTRSMSTGSKIPGMKQIPKKSDKKK